MLNKRPFQALFDALLGVAPSRGRPILGSVPGARTRPLSERATDTPDERPSDPELDAPTPPVDSEPAPTEPDPILGDRIVDPDAAFTPAGQSVADLEQSVTDLLDTPTNRPDVSALIAQRWEPAGYVCDGTHAVILSADQMIRFGIASQIVNTDEELKAFFGAKTLARADQSWSESLVRFMTSIPVRGVLIVIFLLALFLEMSAPGMVAPGAVALGAAVALLAPPMLIGMAGWWEIAAIVSGVLLIALEILVLPGFGVFGVAGLLLLFGGLVGTFIPDANSFPGAPGQDKDLLFGVVTIVLAAATAGVGMYFIGKHFGSLPIVSRLVLTDAAPDETIDPALGATRPTPEAPVSVGDTGRAITPLRPSGRAEFGEHVIDVVADMGYIDQDAPVRVVSADEFKVVVEQAGPEGAST